MRDLDPLLAGFEQVAPREASDIVSQTQNLAQPATQYSQLELALREDLRRGRYAEGWQRFQEAYPDGLQCTSIEKTRHAVLAASLARNCGFLEAAASLIGPALNVLRDSNDTNSLIEALLVRGNIELSLGKYLEALGAFEGAAAYSGLHSGASKLLLRSRFMIGLTHKRRGKWLVAVDCYERALALPVDSTEIDAVAERARIHANLAVVELRLGRIAASRSSISLATRIAEEFGGATIIGKNMAALEAEHLRLHGKYRDSVEILRSVRVWASDQSDARTEGLCHEYLADVRADQGRPDAAIRHLGRALSLALEKFPETDMVCEAQRRRAEVLVQLGRGAEAREAAEEALRVSSKIAEPYEIGLAHRALGVVLAHEGDGEAALRELARCEEILAELGEKFERTRTLLQRGRLLKSTGATGEAAEALERARQIFTEMELPNWVERVDELLLERELPEAPHLLTGRPLNTPDRFGIITRDPRMLALWQDLTRAAATKLPVLIEGESGTGKELFAQAVHQLSPRQGKEFVPINCGAIPHDMQESELFGHARGSFTGSVDDRPGLFETAHGGTLFLDEIGEMAHTAQVKLLRALETGQVRRIGDRGQRTVDVRYVAATNVGIQAAVAAGRFREDLFHRLDGFAMTIPPLRERRADIPLLVDFFVGRAARENDRDVRVGPALMNRLMAYDWRGNVRELRNKVTRAVMLAGRPGELSVADFPFLLNAGGAAPVTIDQDMDQIERARILKALEETNWSKSAAARLLNVQRTTLHSRMERLGIPIRKPGGRERAH